MHFVFQLQKPLHASLSYSSSCVSASEFFDAEEYQLHEDRQGGRDGSDTSSEAGSLTSEEGSISSENSEVGTEYTPAQSCKYDPSVHEANSNHIDRTFLC
jgi:hypothetical protein